MCHVCFKDMQGETVQSHLKAYAWTTGPSLIRHIFSAPYMNQASCYAGRPGVSVRLLWHMWLAYKKAWSRTGLTAAATKALTKEELD